MSYNKIAVMSISVKTLGSISNLFEKSIAGLILANHLSTYNHPFPIWFWEPHLVNYCLKHTSSYPSADRRDLWKKLSSLQLSHLLYLYGRETYSDSIFCYFHEVVDFMLTQALVFLNNIEADCLISVKYPHHFGSYSVLCAANLLKIPCYIVEPNWYGSDDHLNSAHLLDYWGKCYISSEASIASSRVSSDIVFNHLSQNKSQSYAKSFATQYDTILSTNKRFSLDAVKLKLPIDVSQSVLRSLRQIVDSKRRVSQTCQSPKTTSSYILLMLCCEPEASISPRSPDYPSQNIFIRDVISICNEIGLPFLVREHPFHLSMSSIEIHANLHIGGHKLVDYRPAGFYEGIESSPLFGGYANNEDLSYYLNDSKCVGFASMSPSGPLQALAAGKRANITTSPKFFSEHSNIFCISTSELRAVIPQIKKQLSKTDDVSSACHQLQQIISRYIIADIKNKDFVAAALQKIVVSS